MDYWQRLRTALGAGTLITVGAGVIVRRGEAVLLQRRSDDGDWGIPGGAKELGESLEETGLSAASLRFLVLCSGPRYSHVYPDGSRIDHVAALYEATDVRGVPRAAGRETLELGYFGVGNLPRMQPLSWLLLERALETLSG